MKTLTQLGLLAATLSTATVPSLAHAQDSPALRNDETSLMRPGHNGPRGPRGPQRGYPPPGGGWYGGGPIWRMYAYGGYYDITGQIPGAQRLAQMRSYGGQFEYGEPIPNYWIACDALGHICQQPGYGPPSFGACYNEQHYE